MNVRRMYHELLVTSLFLNFFDSFLSSMAAFSVSYFIAYFYRISYKFALVPAAGFFIWSLQRKIRTNKILVLENKYPALKERLRTSFDNQEQNNTVLNELHSEIVMLMRSVDVNAFLSSKKLFIKITSISVVLVSLIYLSSVGFDVKDVQRAVTQSVPFRNVQDFTNRVLDIKEETPNRPKLNEPRLLDLGERDINVTIDTFNTELDTQEIDDPEKNDFGGHYPEEVHGAAQETYDEGIPEEHKNVIKEYFRKINE